MSMGDATARVNCILHNSHSQLGEDLVLWPTLLLSAGAHRPIFIELGAFDGVTYSNSLLLERCFGFHGLLIESNPTNFAKLNHSGRAAALEHSAVCEGTPGTVRVLAAPAAGNGEVGLGCTGSCYARSKVVGFAAAKAQLAGRAEVMTSVEVPCRSLTAMIEQHLGRARAREPGAVAFLSLDVQGAELKVLRAVDPAVFGLVMVELDGTDAAKDEAVRGVLRAAGLLPQPAALFVPESEVWVRPELRVVPVPIPSVRRGRGHTKCGRDAWLFERNGCRFTMPPQRIAELLANVTEAAGPKSWVSRLASPPAPLAPGASVPAPVPAPVPGEREGMPR